MAHWFVSWLQEQAEDEKNLAHSYYEALSSDTPQSRSLLEAFEDRSEILEWAHKHEEAADRLKDWALLAEDMIRCGLEREALAYYDAKQAIEPWLLPARRKVEFTHAITSILEYLERRHKETETLQEIEDIKDIESTLNELFGAGMDEAALVYYMRKIRKNPELGLPDIDSSLSS